MPNENSSRTGTESVITMAHGGGGAATAELLADVFLPAFTNSLSAGAHDGALISPDSMQLAVTTDSYVVNPWCFPGADIGHLAINGTVNDLAMCGAQPNYITAGFILEEGLLLDDLHRVVRSMQSACKAAGIALIAGDTKVVERGKADGLYINTTGIGMVRSQSTISPASVCEGDMVLLSGDIGRHGMAVMSARESLAFDPPIQSDCAALHEPVLALLEAGVPVHCLRDATRGGVGGVLAEIASDANLIIDIDERLVPVSDSVRGACEILGLDPLYVANEGRFIAFVPESVQNIALTTLRDHQVSSGAVCIGQVTQSMALTMPAESFSNSSPGAMVRARTAIGGERVIDLPTGDALPRIC